VAALPRHEAKLFALKRRPAQKHIAWLVAEAGALDAYGVAVPQYARALARAYWPGALTLIVRGSADLVSAGWPTIALRMPDDAVMLEVLRLVGQPLAVSSANLSGAPAPVELAQVDAAILNGADYAVDGGVAPHRAASTIVDCTGPAPAIVREGPIKL
jgi:tRNA threonylcarbamoyl adenosine modification protein (Sua5/YciO/YrdC/YwlC family)